MARKTKQSPSALIPQDVPAQDDVQEQLKQQFSQLLPGVLPQDEGPHIKASVDVDGPKSKRMDDDTLLAIVNQLEERAKTYVRSKVMHRATKIQEYFFAQADGDFAQNQNGRSDFVDTSVADTVRWLECPLVEVFCGTQKIVDYIANNSAQQQSAESIEAMVNHVWQQNDGYEIMRTWINDALINPAGIVKIFWEPDSTRKSTRYEGLSDDEFAVIALAAQAGECMIVSHDQYQNPQFDPLTVLQHGLAMAGASGAPSPAIAPQLQQQAQAGANPLQIAANTQIDPNLPAISNTLHDVTVVVMPDGKKGKVKIENIPLDEFYVDPTARRIKDARYAAHACKKTISELRAMQFDPDLLDDIENTDDPAFTELAIARNRMDDVTGFDYDLGNRDPSMREVTVVEAYVQMDYDGDDIAEWRKIVKAGNTILLNEPCDGNPFCVMVSVPISHTLFGMSVAELAMNIQKQNTAFIRALIDNVTFGADAALWVQSDAVDITHVQTIGPGSVIPIDSDNPAAAIGVVPNSSGDVAALTQVLELFDLLKQERTGVMKNVQSNDADMINDTATGYLKQIEQGEARTKLITRHFSETGVKPAALRIQALLAQHQDEYMEVRINGQTLKADPMDARNQFDMRVQVGLGTGDKGRTFGALAQILQLQMQAMQQNTGMVDLNLIYNTVERMVGSLGVANASEFVHKPPSPMPQVPPPQVSPDKQAELQIEQQKAQSEQQRQERQAQLDAMRIQAQAKTDNEQRQMDFQYKLQLLEKQKEIEQLKAILAISAQREQAAFQAGVSPEAEQAMFNETFHSTEQAYGSALTGINMHMSGEMDDLINTISNAPDPTTPDQSGE
ncbi:hypothetical protein BG58_10970 [Caballeronia jiangsuensis]|nr:hypothetical protein BG58_10970 [Caballeronia jiangsuensis]